jgi:hypothetical protein
MNPPVFLQTGFRTGGTWLWSRFRQCPEVMAFCEPLNEALESITQEANSGITSLTSRLNHPTLDAPYFQEFTAFMGTHVAGVRHYRTEFGLQTYFEPPDEQPQELAHYLSQILDYAVQHGKQPVLKFTRALGRADWLRRTFPSAKQILLVRNPWPQFQSGWELAKRHQNFTFLMIPLFALSRPRTGALRFLCDELGIPHVPYSEGVGKCAETYTELARQLPPHVLFGAFLGMFIASHAKSIPFADLVIDYEAFERDDFYRNEIERSICNLSGIRVDLSNHQAGRTGDIPALASWDVEPISNTIYSILETDYKTSVNFARQLLSGHLLRGVI